MATVKPITSEDAFNEHISGTSNLLVIYFHAPWAQPCQQMSEILATLASTYSESDPISFISLDAEEVSEISEQYDVTQVPLVVLQKDGSVVDSITGTDASKLRNAVEKHVAVQGTEKSNRAGLPPAQTVTRPPPSSTNGAPHTNGDAPAAEEQKPEEDINERLSTLVKAAPVMLFMKGKPSAPECGFSRQTVSLLREKGVRYGFFNILADDEVRQGLKAFSDWPTFPQVYVGGELVGGLDIVSSHSATETRPYRANGTTFSSRKSSRTIRTS